jgi:hypothetical protein
MAHRTTCPVCDRERCNHDRRIGDLWFYRPPSRWLRKQYAALDAVQAEMDAVRASNPCPDHAPTAHVIIAHRLRELRVREDEILRRIERRQHGD